MGTLERYDAAVAGFRRRLAPLRDGDFDRPSPCDGWTAGDLVDHTISTLNSVADLVGEPAADELATTRLARFDAAASNLRAKVEDPGLASTVVDSPFGTLALKQLVSSIVVHDVLVHSWDLARSTGGDEVLDPELVTHTMAAMGPFDELLRGHGFAAKVVAPEGADAQTELLCFLGRRP